MRPPNHIFIKLRELLDFIDKHGQPDVPVQLSEFSRTNMDGNCQEAYRLADGAVIAVFVHDGYISEVTHESPSATWAGWEPGVLKLEVVHG